MPAILKYRKLFAEVLLASFFLQLFALVTPLFFQVIIDKVLVHRGLTTLDVLAIGMLALAVFEIVLGGLRSYVFAHTTNRMDVLLGAKLFSHLLRLPLAYFEARRVGDSVARVRELENIVERAFIICQGPVIGLEHLPVEVADQLARAVSALLEIVLQSVRSGISASPRPARLASSMP